MIDPLETTANWVDSGRLDEAEIICGTALRTKPNDSSALCLMGRDANAHKVDARTLDDLARVENPELAQLYVETAIAHRGFGARGAAVRATQQPVLLGRAERLPAEFDCAPTTFEVRGRDKRRNNTRRAEVERVI
jgi:hypothetical protein